MKQAIVVAIDKHHGILGVVDVRTSGIVPNSEGTVAQCLPASAAEDLCKGLTEATRGWHVGVVHLSIEANERSVLASSYPHKVTAADIIAMISELGEISMVEAGKIGEALEAHLP